MKTTRRFAGVALLTAAMGFASQPQSGAWVAVPLQGAATTASAAGRAPEHVALTKHLAQKYRQSVELTHRIVKAAYREGAVFGVPPLLVLAIIEKESSLRPGAQSGYGAVGLMQVVPRFHREKLGPGQQEKELQVPEINIKVGAQILAESLRRKNGDLEKALVQYSGNATNYSKKVSEFQEELRVVRDSARMNEGWPRSI